MIVIILSIVFDHHLSPTDFPHPLGQLRSSPRPSDETEALYAKDWTRSVSGHPSPAAIENWKKVRRVWLGKGKT